MGLTMSARQVFSSLTLLNANANMPSFQLPRPRHSSVCWQSDKVAFFKLAIIVVIGTVSRFSSALYVKYSL